MGSAARSTTNDAPTDESILFVGANLGPDEAPTTITAEQADVIFGMLEEPPRRASPALRKLLLGV